MTAATLTHQSVMSRAWELMNEHMRWNKFSQFLMGRFLRQAWEEAKQRTQGVTPVCDMTPTECALVTSMADPDSCPRDEADLARRRAQEAADHAEKRELIEAAKGQFCAVTFIKADGTERTMKVQPAALKFHVKGDAATEAGKKAVATRKARHPHLLPVWDVEKQAVRSVNLATVQTINVGGLAHAY